MHYRIIANPIAGKGECGEAIPTVKQHLENLNVTYDLVCTERPWHAAELAREAAEDCDCVVSMGGDGTANEVLNGLMSVSGGEMGSCAMGVLCVGRGNDFAFGVGIPHDLEAGCRALQAGQTRIIDVGRVTVDDESPRFFGNGIGIGFDAVVGFEAAKFKHLHGFMGYLAAALKTLFVDFEPPTVALAYGDQKLVQPSLMVSIMNGRRMGGGFLMAPEADPDDELLDLCIVGMAGKFHILKLMGDFLKGTQAGKDPVRTGRTPEITIMAEAGSLPAHADGETLCVQGHRMQVELLPKRLKMIVG